MFKRTIEDEVRETGRIAARLMTDHFLRQVEVLARMRNGDLLSGIIFLAILSANVRHLTEDPVLSKTYAGTADLVPQNMRIPISVNAVATSLGLPYETTRRYVNRMIRDGQCIKVGKQGVIIPNDAVDLMMTRNLIHQGLANLRHFIAALNRSGYDLTGE